MARGTLITGAFAALLLALLVLLAPRPAAFGLREIAADRITVIPPSARMVPSQPGMTSKQTHLADQFSWDRKVARQYHLITEPDEPQAVFAPMLGDTADLWINAIPAGSSTLHSLKAPGFGRAHMLLAPPAAYYNFDRNRLDIVMESDPDHAGLRSLWLGRTDQIAALAESWARTLQRVRIALLVAGLIGLACLLAGFLARRRSLFYLSGGGLSLALLFYASAFDGWPLIGTAPLWSFALLAIAASAVALWLSLRRTEVIQTAVATTALFASALGLLLSLSPWHIPQPIMASWIASTGLIPFAMLGLPLSIAQDWRHYLAELALARAKISAQQTIIANQEAEIEAQIRSKAIVEERQRFVRDMHDGVGGQLLSLLMRVRMKRVDLGDVEDEIQKGLTDLRLVADSLDNVGNDIDKALATFQTRAQQQLDAAGIAFHWQKPESLSGAQLDARQILNLYRLLQEALSNAVRHSGCDSFRVEFVERKGQEGWEIIVADNGKGFDSTQVKAGHGLANMRKRAVAFGGDLSIDSVKPHGTKITVTLPKL
jgi:signal transduction histidine kinase